MTTKNLGGMTDQEIQAKIKDSRQGDGKFGSWDSPQSTVTLDLTKAAPSSGMEERSPDPITPIEEVALAWREHELEAFRYGQTHGWKELVNSKEAGARTPWGTADYTYPWAPGICEYATPGHGGIKLSPERNKFIPPKLRKADGWYEEDCEFHIVAATYPREFAASRKRSDDQAWIDESRQSSIKSASDWFRKNVEAQFGVDTGLAAEEALAAEFQRALDQPGVMRAEVFNTKILDDGRVRVYVNPEAAGGTNMATVFHMSQGDFANLPRGKQPADSWDAVAIDTAHFTPDPPSEEHLKARDQRVKEQVQSTQRREKRDAVISRRIQAKMPLLKPGSEPTEREQERIDAFLNKRYNFGEGIGIMTVRQHLEKFPPVELTATTSGNRKEWRYGQCYREGNTIYVPHRVPAALVKYSPLKDLPGIHSIEHDTEIDQLDG